GGFAGPVGADEHDALAALGLEIHAAIDDVGAVGVVDIFERDDFEPAAPGLGELEINFAVVAGGCLDLVHPFDLFELALGLGGFGVLGAKPVDDFHQAVNLSLVVYVGG